MVSMKIVVESNAGTGWGVYEYMFGSYCNLGHRENLSDALTMANNFSKSKWMPIEFRVQTSTGDDGEHVYSQYLRSDADVLQAILTHC